MTQGEVSTETATSSTANPPTKPGTMPPVTPEAGTDNAKRRTRRRGTALENELLEAAWDELTAKGWRGFTMEGVAARAGSGKAPLYARWPNRVALVRAAMIHNGSLRPTDRPSWSSTGNLRDDLVQSLQRSSRHFQTPFGEAMRAVISEAGDRPFPANDEQQPIEPVLIILQRAYERADPATDGITFGKAPREIPAAVINLGPQIASLDFLANGQASSPYRMEQIVDQIWLPLLRHHAT